MKRPLLVACALACIASPVAAQDFWTKLGMSEQDAKGYIWNGVSRSSFYIPALPALRALPAASRNALITQATAYAKTWSRSPDFKARYDEFRESNKPRAPELMPSTAERKKKDREMFEKSIKDIEASAKSLPADQQTMIKQMIQMQKDQLKAIDDPKNPAYGKDIEAAFIAQNAAQTAEHAEELKKWEAKYPPAPNAMLRANISAFLTMTDGIDFGAALAKQANGKMLFVNPAYEAKPAAWKMLFRAGRETSVAIRAAAQAWLTELPK